MPEQAPEKKACHLEELGSLNLIKLSILRVLSASCVIKQLQKP